MTPKSKTRTFDVNVHLRATIHPADTMFLRVHVGEAKQDGREFEMAVNAAAYTPIVRLPDGRWVTFGWEQLVRAADDAGKLKVGMS